MRITANRETAEEVTVETIPDWLHRADLPTSAYVVIDNHRLDDNKPYLYKTSDYGKVLATSSGLTLYHYTDETRGKVDCKGACAKLWPPLLVKAGTKPLVGAGLTASKLGTIKRPEEANVQWAS